MTHGWVRCGRLWGRLWTFIQGFPPPSADTRPRKFVAFEQQCPPFSIKRAARPTTVLALAPHSVIRPSPPCHVMGKSRETEDRKNSVSAHWVLVRVGMGGT